LTWNDHDAFVLCIQS